jgi:hypothetical protein
MDQYVAKARGSNAGLLIAEEKEPPEETVYLLQWYSELSGAENLTYSEIESWSKLKKRDLEPFEVDALIALDRIKRTADFENMSKGSDN